MKSNKIFQLNYQIEKQKQNVKKNEIPKGHKHRLQQNCHKTVIFFTKCKIHKQPSRGALENRSC